MAYYNNRYQYETSPRKVKPEYQPVKKTYPKKSTARKKVESKESKKTNKMNRLQKLKILSYVAVVFSALFVISYRYSLIDETYSDLTELKSELSLVEKETAQLEANLESSLNLSTIEQEAEELLGMQKLSSEQIVYVSLPKSDYVEASSEEVEDEESSNWVTEVMNKIGETLR